MRALGHRLGAGLLAVLLSAVPALAQESASASVAAQLVAALDAAKLQNVAAKDPAAPDRYVAALYLPGLQLVVISGKYAAPPLLDQRLANREYREVYVELNGAAERATRILVTDLGANGLRFSPSGDQPADICEMEGRRTIFNRQWRDQQLSEDEYRKIYAAADARYTELLTALLAQLKTTS